MERYEVQIFTYLLNKPVNMRNGEQNKTTLSNADVGESNPQSAYTLSVAKI